MSLMLRRQAMMAAKGKAAGWRLVWEYNSATDGLLSAQPYITFTKSTLATESITSQGRLYIDTVDDRSHYLKYEFAHGNNTAGRLEMRYRIPAVSMFATDYNGFITSISNGASGSIVTRGRNGNNDTILKAYPWVNSARGTASKTLDTSLWYEEIVEFSADGQKVTIDGITSTDIATLSATTTNYIMLKSRRYYNAPGAFIAYIRYYEK